MIAFTTNGDAREVSGSRSQFSGHPVLDGDVYRVVPKGGKFEVHCVTYSHGREMTDAIVNTFDYESAAECVARALTDAEGEGHGD